MQQPVQQGEAFLADVAQARDQRGDLHIWWLGQSGFLVLWGDAFLLLDPYLSDSLTTKYADTDTPHTRLTAQVIDPARLDFLSVVTSSHNHTDHLDADTLRPLLAANPALTVLVPAANRAIAAERLGVAPDRLTGIHVGRPQTAGAFTFHAVPAAHEDLVTDEAGDHKFIGLVVQAGPWTLYHSGDTLRYDGLVEHLRPFGIDVAMLPINGRDAARGVAGNLSGPEAVALAQNAGIGTVIPCHYDMFAFNTASPDAFQTAAATAGQPIHVMANGERWSLPGR
jgi:L-ascorbate metabolism protein UlaG (beta-lactamase superfamily)